LSTGSAAAAQVPPVGEPASCQLVRLSDIGWTDVTATTALTSTLLRSLGYQTQVTLLSVPVTFASMRNKDIDVFMGNWMPSQVADRKPFDEDHSIDVIGANLTGAKYTLAVPAYTYEAGIKDFADIKRIGAELNHSIYGIEAGNDGNRHVLNLINKKQFGLGDFKLVESSEQGMLAEVDRAIAEHRPIVFLAWEPHPMNTRYHIKYLTGGDSEFGPDFGGTSVFTNTRAGYTQECPNVGRLLKNLKFTVSGEEELMSSILDTHGDPDTAAAAWLQAHPEVRSSWLEGVRAVDGTPALQPRAKREIVRNADQWIVDHKIPVGDFMARLIDVIKTHGKVFFRVVSMTIAGGVNGLTYVLNAIPSLWLVGVFMLLAWLPRRSWGLALFVGLALLFIINQGYWAATCETLSLVSLSALVSTLVGVPIGIAAAHRPRLYAALRPVLDLMQTLPTFVYLIPTLVLFGLGVVPGLISTVIFALPAPIRLTHLGISSVPVALREAGEAFGATRLQLLWKVELPSAAPSIMAGVTQCTMLCLSMVVIAALVGAGGLGVPVVRALNTVQVGTGFEAGFAIVLLAIVLDRISRSANRERK
jgi:glycine betaine/proline transport system substrate-binding protein